MESVILVGILGLQTLVIIALVISVIIALKRGRRTLDEVEGILETAQPRIRQIIQDLSQFVNEARPISGQLVEISINLKEISRMARETSHNVRDTVTEATSRAHFQIRRVDDAITDTLDKTEETAEVFTKNVIDPVVEISAIVKGIRVGLQSFQHLRRHRD